MLFRLLVTSFAALTLVACQSTQDGATMSGFASPTANGTITNDLENTGSKINRFLRDGDGDGYAYAAGTVDGEGLAAYAGILPTTNVAQPPVSGRGIYDARFGMVEIRNINLNGNFITGSPSIQSGDITLRANFDAGTIRGEGDGLSVDGNIGTGRYFDGNVSWRGLEGDLRGQVGRDKVVGAFHGNNKDLIYAGGLIGTPR